MHVLILGGGGREHALAFAMARSPLVSRLSCAPGNAGIAALAECVAFDPADPAAVHEFCRREDVGFVVVGPEAPLVAGVVDALHDAGIAAFGPRRAAAVLEASKGFVKDLCARENIPTAAYRRFTDREAALAHLDARAAPVVVKADGLAAGKGVVVAESRAEAREAVQAMFAGAFGDAGAQVVIEDFMAGEEASFFALTDGEAVLPLATAQDHKRVFDRDEGPNTGGMGAYSPAPVMTPALCDAVMERIIRPTVRAMAQAGTPYRGVLYAGLMLTPDGPKLVEFNARFGDPECQVLMPRLAGDIVPALMASAGGGLSDIRLDWKPETALTVVMAAKGYPGPYQKGSVIGGLDAAAALPGVTVFHAGTARDAGGAIVAAGGRVLNVTALGATVKEAQARAYQAVDRIDWPGGFCRRDIGWRAIARAAT